MKKNILGKGLAALLCVGVLFMLSGCETMTAFGTGKMKASDVMYIVQGQNVELSAAQSTALAPGQEIKRDYDNIVFWKNADVWIKKNLW